MPGATTTRGRPREQLLADRVLGVTLELLEVSGYEGLRMSQVAARARVGLGAVYRRWPSKDSLVEAALRMRSDELDLRATDDPCADLLHALIGIRDQLARGAGFVLPPLLVDHDSAMSRAILQAKVEPLRTFLLDRLEATLGPRSDLSLRADLGPALIIYGLLTTGSAPADDYLESEILGRMLS